MFKCLVPLLLLLAACDGAVENQHPEDEQLVKPGIHWFDGSVEEGFALARQEQKPVYLYWGAVWCPPCQEIKHTVFLNKQFIAQTELFIPIYLDGDTDRAQYWGDKFGVKGYPTMIVFNPDGEEVTRIPGGIDISRYNRILALSLDRMRPTSMLVEMALNNPEQLLDSDYIQLAYYSWGQDSGSLPAGTPVTFFRDLSDKSPDKEASARLYMEYLVALTRQDGRADAVTSQEGSNAFSRVSTILDSTKLTLACWESLGYYAGEVIELPLFTGSQKTVLKSQWQEQFLALRHQSSLSTAEQLTGWLPLLSFHYLDGNETPLPKNVIVDLKADLDNADKKTTNSFARQSVVSQLNYLYQSAKLFEDARSLLLEELGKSESPYYFMSSLSSLAEKEDDISSALEWRRKAYETSQGDATRFQWGANYIRTLIRLTPGDHELIRSTSMALFDELGGSQAVFAGRNFRVLRSLNKALLTWQEEQNRDDLAVQFLTRIQAMCSEQDSESLEWKNCSSLVDGSST